MDKLPVNHWRCCGRNIAAKFCSKCGSESPPIEKDKPDLEVDGIPVSYTLCTETLDHEKLTKIVMATHFTFETFFRLNPLLKLEPKPWHKEATWVCSVYDEQLSEDGVSMISLEWDLAKRDHSIYGPPIDLA
jgi:hypothetical protein